MAVAVAINPRHISMSPPSAQPADQLRGPRCCIPSLSGRELPFVLSTIRKQLRLYLLDLGMMVAVDRLPCRAVTQRFGGFGPRSSTSDRLLDRLPEASQVRRGACRANLHQSALDPA